MMLKQKITVGILDGAELIKTRLLSVIDETEAFVLMDLNIQDVESVDADVIILDIYLLNGESLPLIRRLKSLSQSPLVIVFTSHVNTQSEYMCWQAGADYFFDKAYDFERLTAVLANMEVVNA
jgi:DNA-binding response OmpR family regulator